MKIFVAKFGENWLLWLRNMTSKWHKFRLFWNENIRFVHFFVKQPHKIRNSTNSKKCLIIILQCKESAYLLLIVNLIRFTLKTHFSADFKYRELEKVAPKIELTYDDITEEDAHQKKHQKRKKRKVTPTLGVLSK